MKKLYEIKVVYIGYDRDPMTVIATDYKIYDRSVGYTAHISGAKGIIPFNNVMAIEIKDYDPMSKEEYSKWMKDNLDVDVPT